MNNPRNLTALMTLALITAMESPDSLQPVKPRAPKKDLGLRPTFTAARQAEAFKKRQAKLARRAKRNYKKED